MFTPTSMRKVNIFVREEDIEQATVALMRLEALDLRNGEPGERWERAERRGLARLLGWRVHDLWWRQRIGQEAAQAISNKASSAGTRLHKQIAAFLRGDVIDIPADVGGYWESMQPVLNDVDEALLVEGAVWHEAGYVGFPDAVMVYQNRLCVCDWKTALKPKKREWIGDYCLQVAAYARAIEQVYAQTGIEVEGALIAIALDQTPAQTIWLERDDIATHWQQFQQRLEEYYLLRPRVS